MGTYKVYRNETRGGGRKLVKALCSACIAAVIALGAIAVFAALPGRAYAEARVEADFNGDGFDDIAVGVLSENIGSISNAGAVNVIYGSSGAGLTSAGNQFWHQSSLGILDAAEGFDEFGRSLTSGDFDGDGFDDLAIGVPEDIGNLDAGAVNVIYGSSGVGLTSAGDQFRHQDSPGILGIGDFADIFGFSLTAGDFDGDGFDDLAVGVPGDDFVFRQKIISAGAVNVIYGISGKGLNSAGNQLWNQDSPGILTTAEEFDSFGSSLSN